ncbi:MAG TPA: hypothetical protein VHX15_00220, partial [Frankiaceae bacterium]|nr:hypothetical protein [Frankiaceae bacterium]
PDFAAALEDHMAIYGMLLPHVLFGDLTRFVMDAHDSGDLQLAARCLAFLDEALRTGDEDTKNLVTVSFVENVDPWNEASQPFIDSWPKALHDEALRQAGAQGPQRPHRAGAGSLC